MGYGDQAAGHYGAGLVDDAAADAGCWCAAGILLDQGELFWNAVVFFAAGFNGLLKLYNE